MESKNIIAQLIDYREGNLTAEQALEVKKHLKTSKEWQNIRKELELLDTLMQNAPIVQPSANSKQRFEQLLIAEKQATPIVSINPTRATRFINIRQLLQIAAAITLLIMGVGIGTQWKNNQTQQAEIANLKAEMVAQKKLLALSMLGQSSASDRIKGVNISLEETKMDDQILTALIERMNIDENANVQIKAIEGLAQFGENQKVITAFIKTLGKQKNPAVQIAIMEVLIEFKSKEAYPQFQEILQDAETIDAVKNKAAAGLEILL